ncbi:MAG: hypothetical protein ABI740_03730 [Alphaproteobacteria bacterium]
MANFAWADIQPILTPLTYRELLGKKCGAPNIRVKTAFLADLKSAGASRELLAQSKAEVNRIQNEEHHTLNEYVCTAELFESTETNADAALKAWSDLKGRKS